MKKLKYALILVTIACLFLPTILKGILPISFVYWVWLVLITEFILMFQLSSKVVFYSALLLTVVGAIFAVFKIAFATQFLIVGFIFWISGYILNFIELLKKSPSNGKNQ